MNKRGEINIIGGKYRAKKLKVPSAASLRPTPNRVRETLFNWLQFEIVGAQTLDLFAGSGLLSFEALSRGAAKATIIEKNQKVFQHLQAMKQQFPEELIQLHCGSASQYIKQHPLTEFDVIFLDPPFDGDLLSNTLTILHQQLKPGCKIYFETDKELLHPIVNGEIIKQKKTASVYYGLIEID